MMSHATDPLRAVVITGAIFPEHLELWRGCEEAGADVTIVGTEFDFYRGKWPWEPRRPDDLKSVVMDPSSPRLSKGHLWWRYPGLVDVLRASRPDVIHVLSEPWGLLVVDALRQRKRSEIKAAVCAHGADNIYHHGGFGERSIRRAILRWTLPRLDGFVSWNHAGIDLAHESGLSTTAPTSVLPAVIPDAEGIQPPNAAERSQLRERFGLPRDEVIVGFFGRLLEEKGIGDLIEAIGGIDEGAPFLAAYGAGPLQERLERSIASGAIRGTYGGSLDFATVIDAMRACDIVAIPSKRTSSWTEQFGRVALEGMLAGCAVVAYKSGALPEVVGTGGILVQEGDVAELGRALERLSRDEGTRKTVAANGRQSILDKYHRKALGRTVVEFWEQLARRRVG